MKKAAKTTKKTSGDSPSKRIDERIQSLSDWRGKTLARVRNLIKQAYPAVTEEWKWSVPVWSHNGIICTGESYKNAVKLTFPKGASLKDPSKIFNSSLEGKTRRAIDFHEGDKIDEKSFKTLVRAAAELNSVGKTKLLSGGNPQIAKAEGDAPVQAYIAAMPGWKREVGHQLDALIVRTVPNVRKAVKWNSPFYGTGEKTWFLGIHCFNKYIKVAFFQGMSLRPLPPDESKQKEVRYLDIRENDKLDEAQFRDWVKQASQLSGQRM